MSNTAGAVGFPFVAVVGQDDVKLALMIAVVEPRLGGVLLWGESGSAKTTLARGLAEAITGDSLPAPEAHSARGGGDRAGGTADLSAGLQDGERYLSPGLLADMAGGVLCLDGVNLLPDHLVEAFFDAAAAGASRAEQDGVGDRHSPGLFLVGSMDRAEGELRPHLLDRFGLAVEVASPSDALARGEAVRRRLAYDADPHAFVASFAAETRALASRLATCRPAHVSDPIVDVAVRLAVGLRARGLRGDLSLCRAAAALAGLEGRCETSVDDVARVAGLALGHRRRSAPGAPPGLSRSEVDAALELAVRDQAGRLTRARHPATDHALSGGGPPVSFAPAGQSAARMALVSMEPVASARRSSHPAAGERSRDASSGSGGLVEVSDLQELVEERRLCHLVVLCVDASGATGAEERASAARGAVLRLLTDAYQRRDRVAVVSFSGAGAQLLLRPTASIEVARSRLATVPIGGPTPLAEAISRALQVCLAPSTRGFSPVLVVISDGRATSAPDGLDPLAAAMAAADRVASAGISALVVDVESGQTPLGLAEAIAERMGARYLRLATATGEGIDKAVRALLVDIHREA
ncbi:MAG: VWA domain-containing protein [Acidimicrobiales bacterium]